MSPRWGRSGAEGRPNGITTRRKIRLCPHSCPIKTRRSQTVSGQLMGRSEDHFSSAIVSTSLGLFVYICIFSHPLCLLKSSAHRNVSLKRFSKCFLIMIMNYMNHFIYMLNKNIRFELCFSKSIVQIRIYSIVEYI